MKLKNLLQTIIIYITVTNIVTSQSNIIQLKNNWHLQSSAVIEENAKSISSVGYNSENWYKVDIPKTVLAAMAEAEVYPDPYFGLNLKSIPGYREGRWLADRLSPDKRLQIVCRSAFNHTTKEVVMSVFQAS